MTDEKKDLTPDEFLTMADTANRASLEGYISSDPDDDTVILFGRSRFRCPSHPIQKDLIAGIKLGSTFRCNGSSIKKMWSATVFLQQPSSQDAVNLYNLLDLISATANLEGSQMGPSGFTNSAITDCPEGCWPHVRCCRWEVDPNGGWRCAEYCWECDCFGSLGQDFSSQTRPYDVDTSRRCRQGKWCWGLSGGGCLSDGYQYRQCCCKYNCSKKHIQRRSCSGGGGWEDA